MQNRTWDFLTNYLQIFKCYRQGNFHLHFEALGQLSSIQLVSTLEFVLPLRT
jgi:hypothetical protein